MLKYYTYCPQKAEKCRGKMNRVKRPALRRRSAGALQEANPSPVQQVRYATFKDETSIKAGEVVAVLGVSPSHALVRTQGATPTLLSVPLGWFALYFCEEEQ